MRDLFVYWACVPSFLYALNARPYCGFVYRVSQGGWPRSEGVGATGGKVARGEDSGGDVPCLRQVQPALRQAEVRERLRTPYAF